MRTILGNRDEKKIVVYRNIKITQPHTNYFDNLARLGTTNNGRIDMVHSSDTELSLIYNRYFRFMFLIGEFIWNFDQARIKTALTRLYSKLYNLPLNTVSTNPEILITYFVNAPVVDVPLTTLEVLEHLLDRSYTLWYENLSYRFEPTRLSHTPLLSDLTLIGLKKLCSNNGVKLYSGAKRDYVENIAVINELEPLIDERYLPYFTRKFLKRLEN
jgi:hypothetical protein